MRKTALCLAAIGLLAAACSKATSDSTGTDVGEAVERNAKIVDTISPTATIEGQFDPRVRAYGYVVPVKAGAKITAKLEARAGTDARRDDANAPLDTLIQVNAGYESKSKRGAKIASSDDDGDKVEAPPVTFTAERDANYLVTFMSNEDTGTGSYKLSLSCEGTDFQCQRANFDKPCTPGQLFVQGAQIEGNVTWDKCEVVLLESATVTQGSTLTIQPGVQIKGNFIDQQNPASGFGTVSLNVEGRLQGAGTAQNPIVFTSFKQDRGWGGLVIKSTGNTLKNVVIEKANIGVDIPSGGNIEVTDSLIQGVTMQNQRSTAGIRAQQNVDATFTRALVKGFQRGLHLANAQKMTIVDSVIRENNIGIQVDGQNPITSCYNYSPPTVWHDPIIDHSDIVQNERQGVLINGSDVLVQISKSNIVKNGAHALLIQGSSLNPASFFRENNVYDNQGGSQEVRTLHNSGTLDISQNYWKEISDPELSANWRVECGGQIKFTGFAPTLIADAGPRNQDSLAPGVKEGCYKHAAQ